jgi:hypothetical protein
MKQAPRMRGGVVQKVSAMSQPLAYFLTWTTYGTWLPGDARGWVSRRRRDGKVVEAPSAALESFARDLMTETPVILDLSMRGIADEGIRQACREFHWTIRALEVRSNHVHIVVTAGDAGPGKVMGVLKVRATQALNALGAGPERDRWWTKDGSKRILNSPASVAAAIRYVEEQNESR